MPYVVLIVIAINELINYCPQYFTTERYFFALSSLKPSQNREFHIPGNCLDFPFDGHSFLLSNLTA
jgi:hypothetical protein